MNADSYQISVSGIPVQVVRKDIKNLHLSVHPPHGRVRVAAPKAAKEDAIRLAVVKRLSWVKKSRARFEGQPRESPRQMVSGESHYFLGRRYRLRVIPTLGRAEIRIHGRSHIEMHVRPSTTSVRRREILYEWYREELRETAGPLIRKWEKKLGLQAKAWRIRRMRTRWGTCSPSGRRISLNTELAKKSLGCIEYIVVHELLHFVDRTHGERFTAAMDRAIPQWRARRKLLNSGIVAYEEWGY